MAKIMIAGNAVVVKSALKLEDIALADEEIERALEAIEALPKPAARVS